MFDYSYLKGFINERFGSNEKFANFLGISDVALYNKLKNKTSFSQKEILMMQKTLNLSNDQLIQFFFYERS